MAVPDEIRESLVQEIHRAFHGMRRGEMSLHQARLLDDNYHPSPEQLSEARDCDTDRRWEDIPDKSIESLSDALPFLDAAGRRYYLPRFMVYALKPPSTSDGNYAEAAAFDTLANVETYRDEFDELTSDQRSAVTKFMRYLSEQGYSYCTENDTLRQLDDGSYQPLDILPNIIDEYWDHPAGGFPPKRPM